MDDMSTYYSCTTLTFDAAVVFFGTVFFFDEVLDFFATLVFFMALVFFVGGALKLKIRIIITNISFYSLMIENFLNWVSLMHKLSSDQRF